MAQPNLSSACPISALLLSNQGSNDWWALKDHLVPPGLSHPF